MNKPTVTNRIRGFFGELVRESGNRTQRLEHALEQTRQRHGK
ncbi:hypothetical protein [Fulvimarina sp. MAC8]